MDWVLNLSWVKINYTKNKKVIFTFLFSESIISSPNFKLYLLDKITLYSLILESKSLFSGVNMRWNLFSPRQLAVFVRTSLKNQRAKHTFKPSLLLFQHFWQMSWAHKIKNDLLLKTAWTNLKTLPYSN